MDYSAATVSVTSSQQTSLLQESPLQVSFWQQGVSSTTAAPSVTTASAASVASVLASSALLPQEKSDTLNTTASVSFLFDLINKTIFYMCF
jgi:hypothetical protein